MSRVLRYVRPASVASEAVTSHGLFGVSKKHRRKHFSRSRQDFKVVQRPRFRGTGWPQIRPPRSFEAAIQKIAMLLIFNAKLLLSTINQRLFEAIEAMEATEASEAMEAVEAMDAIEATEVVKTTVTEAVWAMEARL